MISRAALLHNTESQQWQAGEALAGQGLLRELRRGEGLIEYMVTLEPYALVRLRAMEDSTCDCGRPHCEHLAGAYLAARQSGALRELESFREQALSDAFLDAVESILPQAPTLTLEPSLFIEAGRRLPGFARGRRPAIRCAPSARLFKGTVRGGAHPDSAGACPDAGLFQRILAAGRCLFARTDGLYAVA